MNKQEKKKIYNQMIEIEIKKSNLKEEFKQKEYDLYIEQHKLLKLLTK